jgi:hypothetical protein
LSIAPHRDWSAQYSIGHLTSPEALHPEEDVLRQTASVMWHHAIGPKANLNATAVWGRNHTIGTAENANSYLVEAALALHKQTIWMRIENADRTTDLLGTTAPSEETTIGRVQLYSGGYAHRIWSNRWSTTELGAQLTTYGVPPTLTNLYSDHPFGAAAVLHWRLGR